ncbi:MAG: hypothetical protein R3C14_38105 [Caldilineaceae bacterium]
MSPTLLEAVIVLALIGLGWQVGVQLAPTVLRHWQQAQAQLDQLDAPVTPQAVGPIQPNRKEVDHERTDEGDTPQTTE